MTVMRRKRRPGSVRGAVRLIAAALATGCGDAERCATGADGAIPAMVAAARARLGAPRGFRHVETRTAEDRRDGHIDAVMTFRLEGDPALRRAAASVSHDCRVIELRIVE